MLGGNLVRAVPDRERMEAAWPGLRLTVHVATKLNRSHLTPGPVSLPAALPGADRQGRAGDAARRRCRWRIRSSHIYGSIGQARRRRARDVRSETAIVAGLAKATLPGNPRLPGTNGLATMG